MAWDAWKPSSPSPTPTASGCTSRSIRELEKYLVFKGSIAIEGISLTVAKLEGLRCSVAIIPHTVECTNLGTLKPGDPVNIETDIIAKYLEKWMIRDRQLTGLSTEALVAKGF